MNLSQMLDASFQFALVLFAIAAACALVIARAGQSFGALGAIIAVLSLWIVLTTVVYLDSYDFDPGWPTLIPSGIFTSIPLVFILLPMLIAANGHWLRSRLFMGLAGAGIYAWLVTPRVISM
jgi:hypothetical protein